MTPSRDYYAELCVAGIFADRGWNIYFPHRDLGMDFIISKTGPDGFELVRPVQVKGKYPEPGKGDKAVYGYVGRLNQIHQQMVLAIPFFDTNAVGQAACVAFMPWSKIKRHQRGYRCEPATFKNGKPAPRRDFRQYFDAEGLRLMETAHWS